MLGVAAMKLRNARSELARYVDADVKDLVLVENCTAAATAVIRAARLRAGDVVIHLSTAYGMVKNALRHAADENDADVCELPVEFHGLGARPLGRNGAPLEDTLAEMCDAFITTGRRVAMVTFDYISSCPGTIMPVRELAAVCKSRNVPTVLCDAAHALGQVRLSMRALEEHGVTHLMADAHKWLYSPKGSAMLWVTGNGECQSTIHPSVIGAVCSNSRTTDFDPEALRGLSEFERRFQYTGTRDYAPLVCVVDALRWREKIGESVILGYNHDLAVWGQEFLAKEWDTEVLVPKECTAFMAHARVPVRSSRAAHLLNRRLKEEHAIHVMAFELPPRVTSQNESRRTHWVRPCAQLFVSREDFRKLAAATLSMAKQCDAAANAGSVWLARTRARVSRTKRESERLEALALATEEANARGVCRAKHTVTFGFDVPATAEGEERGGFGKGARVFSDSARDLAAVEAVAKYSAGALGGGFAGARGSTKAAGNDEAGFSSDDSYARAPSSKFSSPRSAGYLPALAENASLPIGSVARIRRGEASKPGFSASPVSIMDVSGTSSASSVGARSFDGSVDGSVDGSGFAHPDWASRPRGVYASGARNAARE
jgi:selenocysteine lyase/cysteine desulfurase